MTKTIVTIVGITSGVFFLLYLYGMSKLGNKKDLSISNNEPLYVTDDNQRETIIGGSRKRRYKHRKGKTKKH